MRRIWQNRTGRQVVKGAAVWLATMGVIAALHDVRRPEPSRESPPYIGARSIRPEGGLRINGKEVAYRTGPAVALPEYADGTGAYNVRFTRTPVHPADSVTITYASRSDTRTRALRFTADETREFTLAGSLDLEGIVVHAPEAAYRVRVEGAR